MSDQPSDLESMTCAELLEALAQLASEGDHLNAEVATPAHAAPEQAPQVADLIDTQTRMDRIRQLLKDKGCDGA